MKINFMKLTICLFIIITNNLFAYTDSLKAVQILNEVLVDIKQGKIDSTDYYTEKGLALFKKHDDLYNWLSWHRKIGEEWRSERFYDKGLECFKSGLDKTWRNTKSKRELESITGIYGDIGWLYYKNLNAFEPALEYYEEYEILCRDSLKKSDVFVAKYVYTALGNIYSGRRDEAKAKHYFQQIVFISRTNLDWTLFAQAYRNFGGLYNDLDKFSLAIETIEECLISKDSLPTKYNIKLLTDLGLYYYQLKRYKKARGYTDQAKSLFYRNIESFSKRKQADYQYSFYYNYGRINKDEKKTKQAATYYKKALHLLQTDLKDGNRRQMTIMHFNFGELYLVQEELEKAEEYFHKAISYLSPLLSEYEDPHLIPINHLTGEFLLGHAYQKLGKIAAAQYKEDRNTANLYKAIRYYKLADLVDQLRIQNYTTEESILTALAGQRDLKEEIQFVLFELYQRDSQDSIKEKMLIFSEKSRAFLLLEKDKLSKDILGWDEESQKRFYIKQAERKTLEEAIYELKTNNTQDGGDQLNRLKEKWLKVNEALAKLQQQKNEDSKYKFSPSASLNTIRQTLSDDQGLVEFFIGEVYIYIYAISKQGFEVYRKPWTEALVFAIEGLRESLVCDKDAIEIFESNASYLFETLLKEPLAEFPKKIDRLVLVPDHLLNFIPFEILLTSPFEKKTHHYYNMPYLLRRYSISMANSATLYVLQQQKSQIRAEQLFAGYAPKVLADNVPKRDTCEMQQLASIVRGGYSELEGARKEVTEIAASLDGDSIIGKNAIKTHFLTEANNYRILLLSTHGLIDSENPNFSKLLFAPASSQDKADDVLTALELYNLKLNAELVVLSACNTGSGTLYPGEGVYSFSRAFFAAGVPSTVMTLWKVEDYSTFEVMTTFFGYLEEGLSKDKALQQAKLDFLTNNKKNRLGLHPYFWSGVLVSGNTDSLDLQNDSFPWTYVLLFFLLLSIFAFRFFSKKSK